MKRALVALLALVAFAPSVARAELVGEFNARLKDVQKWGSYTAVFDSRVYETDGRPPPELDHAEIHFPRGAGIRRAFLTSRFYCDAERLAVTRNPAVCEHAHFASGKLVLDGRPSILDDVHADIELYLGVPSLAGEVAAAVVLVTSNQQSHAYDFQVLQGHLFKESGRFGHRLELPVRIRPILPHVKLRLAELSLRVKGLRLVRHQRRCVRRTLGTSGRCLARRTVARKIFWTRTPPCPRARKVSFGADYAFVDRETIQRRRKINCRRFIRRPSTHREGKIPG